MLCTRLRSSIVASSSECFQCTSEVLIQQANERFFACRAIDAPLAVQLVYQRGAKGICLRGRKVYVSGSMAGGGSASPRGRYGGGFAVTKIQLFLQYAKFRAFITCKDMLKKWHFSLKNCKRCHNLHYASELRGYALLHVNKMQLYNFTTLQH